MNPVYRALILGGLAFFTVLNLAAAQAPGLPTSDLLYRAGIAFFLAFLGAFGVAEAVVVGRQTVIAAVRKK